MLKSLALIPLLFIAPMPATQTVSFNDGAESRCVEYSLTAYATRADITDLLSDMAESVQEHGCANLTFEQAG